MIAAGSMLAAATALATTIDPSNYNYSMTIAPASGQVTSTLTNFPVLVRLSSTRQSGFNPADCGANGAEQSGRTATLDGEKSFRRLVWLWGKSGGHIMILVR